QVLLSIELGLGRLANEQVDSKCLDSGMDQVADVGDGMAADAADFLVREPVLKLEAEDLALIGGQGLQELDDPRAQLAALGEIERPRVGAQAPKHLLVA